MTNVDEGNGDMTDNDAPGRLVLPQFPLESVVLPSQVLSLHIFEPRYRQLIQDLVDGETRFGVVLITRGSEVGGDDQRAARGTVAELQEAVKLDDGRWLVTVAGTQRYQIERWLEDDPYPQAEVVVLDEQLLEAGDEDVERRYTLLLRDFTKAMAMVAELGGSGTLSDLSADLDVALYQMSVLLPVGPLDKYQLLEADSSLMRLAKLEQLVSEANDLLRFQLSHPDE